MPSIDNFKYGIKEIKDHVIERLVPEENDNEASLQIVQILERSSHENWRYGLAEWSHSIGNEIRKLKRIFLFLIWIFKEGIYLYYCCLSYLLYSNQQESY